MPNAIKELHDAQRELQIAQQHFDEADPADPDNVDIAVLKLQAAELRFGVAYRAVKAS